MAGAPQGSAPVIGRTHVATRHRYDDRTPLSTIRRQPREDRTTPMPHTQDRLHRPTAGHRDLATRIGPSAAGPAGRRCRATTAALTGPGRAHYRAPSGDRPPTGRPETGGQHQEGALVGVAPPDVAELVVAAGLGDEGAWHALVDRFSGLIWHVARGYRLGEADAADVAQTVWLRLLESLPRLREPAAVAGWLVTTTRHECLRSLRRSGRELPDDHIDLVADRPSDDRGPEAAVELAESGELVRRALTRLSLRCQLLLRALAYTPDRSYAEVSAALDMPIGSIGPTRSRCLHHLRRSLRDEAPHLLGEG
jgi:RNA polymerase sigma factor (sigma-70 family)